MGCSITLDQLNCFLQLAQLELDGLKGLAHLSQGWPNISRNDKINLVMSMCLSHHPEVRLGWDSLCGKWIPKAVRKQLQRRSTLQVCFVSCLLLSCCLKQVTKIGQINLEGYYERT